MLQSTQPFVVTVIREPAPAITVGDVILGSLGLTGVLVLCAAVLGGVTALVLIVWHRRHPPASDHLPPVTPQTGPSAPAR